jgi:aspartyl protease family protein
LRQQEWRRDEREEPRGARYRKGGGMIGWALRQLVIWGAVAVLFYVFVGDRLSLSLNPASPMASGAASAPASGQARAAQAPNSLIYRPNRQGHVVLDAVVNGSAVHFLVDTGATLVALTPGDAAAAGFSRSNLVFNVRTATANGVGRAASVKLREIRIGQFSAYDVPAVVMENLGTSLLGQSFLTRLDSYEMRDGALTLNWN